MKYTMKSEGGYWSVYGDATRLIDRDSYQVASNVLYYLHHPERFDSTESCEVARSIRDWTERASS